MRDGQGYWIDEYEMTEREMEEDKYFTFNSRYLLWVANVLGISVKEVGSLLFKCLDVWESHPDYEWYYNEPFAGTRDVYHPLVMGYFTIRLKCPGLKNVTRVLSLVV